ncbi:MAG: hydroxymethylbilane synthase [Eubacteriales bacterium]
MGRKIKVGSRDSQLAVAQSNLIIEAIKKSYPELEFELVTMKTTGDKILDKRLDKIGGKGLFVKELDKALLDEKVDLTIHSLKDLPMEIPSEIPLVGFSKRENPFDVLVFGKDGKLDESLPLGTSSMRRELQIKKLYPNFEVESIRGNLQTRLKKLADANYSGILLAHAGILRLGLTDLKIRVFDEEEMVPAAGQGILAVQGRIGESYYFLDCINDYNAQIAAKAERRFIEALEGSCTSPIGAYANINGTEIKFSGFYCNEKTGECIKEVVTGDAHTSEKIAEKMAVEFRKKIG